ncbi:hypothetical protein B296_00000758 [Ensete ventricosum]|uniref:Uncharacterized protein n=1 Tax=Ensete ventricosum TaxID=4639 RepID=A0A427B5K8_ENSVE|nr:hypothetical protein B296_00000758 [Ensete ventricosum]
MGVVLAITEGVEDVYILGKEAAAAHSALMADLSKALEGLGESQFLRSQDLAISSSEPSNGAILFNDEEKVLSGSSVEDVENLTTNGKLALHDEGWLSPLEHTYTSSPDSIITLSEGSFSEKSDNIEQDLHSNSAGEDLHSVSYKIIDGSESKSVEDQDSNYSTEDVANSLSSVLPADLGDSLQALSLCDGPMVENVGTYDVEKGKSLVANSLMSGNEHYSKLVNGHGDNLDDSSSCFGAISRTTRGKIY